MLDMFKMTFWIKDILMWGAGVWAAAWVPVWPVALCCMSFSPLSFLFPLYHYPLKAKMQTCNLKIMKICRAVSSVCSVLICLDNELTSSALSRIIIVTALLKYHCSGEAAMQTHSLHANPQNSASDSNEDTKLRHDAADVRKALLHLQTTSAEERQRG